MVGVGGWGVEENGEIRSERKLEARSGRPCKALHFFNRWKEESLQEF